MSKELTNNNLNLGGGGGPGDGGGGGNGVILGGTGGPGGGIGPIRTDKRKLVGSNKKERRRTQSINAAFASLRDCIPNVPCDTKVISKK